MGEKTCAKGLPFVFIALAALMAAVGLCLQAPVCAYADDAAAADFYAVLQSDGTLVFQLEPSPSKSDWSYPGSLEGYGSASQVPWHEKADQVKTAKFAEGFAKLKPESLKCWFADCKNMASIDLTNLDASESTTMEKMFKGCSSLTKIEGLKEFNTSSSTYFGSMFRDCASLKSLDLTHFDASRVGVLCFMFNGCSSLEELDMASEGWRTSSLYLMVHVWEGCTSLKSLDLSHLNTSGVSSMTCDFKGCTSLEYLNLSGADTSKVGNLTGMFDGCEALSTVVLGNRFSFSGEKDERQCSLPSGLWKSLADGRLYESDAIPEFVADTYTRVPESDGESGGSESGDGAGNGEGAGEGEGTGGGESSGEQDGSSADESGGGSGADGESADDASPTGGNTPSIPAGAGLSLGKTAKVSGATYKVINSKKAYVAFQKAPNGKKRVIVPATVTLNGKKYAVTSIAKGAFRGSSAKTIVVKTKKLTKKGVKGCFKGSTQLKKVKVPKSKLVAYKRIFNKSNSGRAVNVQ